MLGTYGVIRRRFGILWSCKVSDRGSGMSVSSFGLDCWRGTACKGKLRLTHLWPGGWVAGSAELNQLHQLVPRCQANLWWRAEPFGGAEGWWMLFWNARLLTVAVAQVEAWVTVVAAAAADAADGGSDGDSDGGLSFAVLCYLCPECALVSAGVRRQPHARWRHWQVALARLCVEYEWSFGGGRWNRRGFLWSGGGVGAPFAKCGGCVLG